MARSSRTTRALLLIATGLLAVGVAAPIAGAADAPAEPTETEVDVEINVEDVASISVVHGQTVAFTGFAPNETVEFETTTAYGAHQNEFRQRTADENGVVIADTSYWAVGEWTATGTDSGVIGTVAVRKQTFQEVRFAPPSADEETTLVADSNRLRFDLALDAPALSAEQLAVAVENGTVAGDHVVVPVSDGRATVDVDASALPEGDVHLVVGTTDSTANATATLESTSGLQLGEYEPQSYGASPLRHDVDGDGTLDSADVVALFEHVHRDRVSAYPQHFDFSGNGNVNHFDVVALFECATIDCVEPTNDARLVDGPYEVAEGDVAEVPVSVEETDEAWVNVTFDGGNYTGTVHLTDVEDEATVAVNTYALGHGEPERAFQGEHVANAAESGDLVELLSENDERFLAGVDFRLRAYGEDPTTGANATDASRLVLEQRSTGGVTTYVAPSRALEDADGAEDLLDAATERDTVASGDLLLVEVWASGIEGYVGDDAGSFGTEDVSLSLRREVEGSFGTRSYRHNLSEAPLTEAATVLPDPEKDRFVVAVHPEDVVDTGQKWDVVFEVGPDNPYNTDDEPETAAASFVLEERRLSFDGATTDDGELVVEPTDRSEIVAETNVAPGTETEVYVVLEDATAWREQTVSADGKLVAPFNFEDREDGEPLETIEVTEYGQNSRLSTSGVFVQDPAPSFVPVATSPPRNVTVGSDAQVEATVENAGYAPGSTPVTVTVGGEVVANESVELGLGETWTQSVDLPTDEAGNVEWSVATANAETRGTVTVHAAT